MILLGAVYVLAGVTFSTLAGSASSNEMRVAWRLAAWLISGAAFTAHVGYEHFRLRHSPGTTARHASLAVALGAFALAAAAGIHGRASSAGHQRSMALALVLWPVLTAVPAFVVALGSAAALGSRRRSV